MYKYDLPMDHVAFSTSDRQAAEALLHKLGFAFGSTSKDPFIHVIFDNGYLEWVPAAYDDRSNITCAEGLTAGIRAYYLASSDIRATYEALSGNGYAVHPTGEFSRYGKHGVNHGDVAFRYCIFQSNDLFPAGVGFGSTQQLNPERIFDGHYRHVNDVDTIKSLVFYTDHLEEASSSLSGLERILRGCGDSVHGIPQVAVMGREVYEDVFEVPCGSSEKLSLAAVYFTKADSRYLITQLEDLSVPYLIKEQKLYADVRKALGAFFIFDLDE